MLLTESPWNASTATALEPAAYALRLHGGTEHEQSIPIPPGKHSIGSGPRCSLRLQIPGVAPLQCLIAYDGVNLRVRRWAEHTLLNGEPFDEAALTAGDVLTVGPVDLEVVATGFEEAAEVGDATELESADADADVAASVVAEAVAAEPVVATPIIATPADLVNEDVSADPSQASNSSDSDPTELDVTADYLPVASGKSLADSDEQFAQVDRAIDALNAIDEPLEDYAEGSLEAAVKEPTVLDEPLLLTGPQAAEYGAAAEEVEPVVAPIEETVFEPAVESVAEELPAAVDVTSEAAEWVFRELQVGNAIARGRSRRLVAALRHERVQYDVLAERVSALEQRFEQPLAAGPPPVAVEAVAAAPETNVVERTELAADTSAVEAELAAMREELAARERELAHARYSIDALERQLIDSQHTMNAFADERTHWEEQFTQLETQLSQYVARIQELEQQLEVVRAAAEEALQAAEERAAETKTQAAASEPVAVELPVAQPQTELALANVTETAEEPILNGRRAAAESPSIVDQIAEDWASVAPESEEIVDEAAVPTAEAIAADDAEPEIDAVLEHLRGLSILRTDVEESTVAQEAKTAAEVEPADVQSKSEPTSYLERYSHLFQNDAAPPEPPPRPALVVAEPAVAGEDEESIEQYMAKLMNRMRGDSAEAPTEWAKVAAPPELAKVELPSHEGPMQSLDDMRPRIPAPEFASDMVAMRALANESTRHAIGIHTARMLRRKAKTRAIVSLLGAAVGFYLLLLAPSWKSMQFAAGCAAAITALYWGRLTLTSLIKGIQVGAFHDIDEIADPAEVLHPKLPIDVEPGDEAQLKATIG